jgi:hypothetical protein
MDKLQYQIQYVDNSYRMVDWTEDEYELVGACITDNKHAVVLKDGIFILDHIRAIVHLVPIVEEAPEENQLTDWGFVDPQTAEWLRANGINLGGKSK